MYNILWGHMCVGVYRQERYAFILNETQTNQILQDVRNRFCDVGILYLSDENSTVL